MTFIYLILGPDTQMETTEVITTLATDTPEIKYPCKLSVLPVYI